MSRGLNLLSASALAIAVCAPAVAQNAPTANAAPTQTAAAQTPSSAVSTLKASSQLVVVDVVVTGSDRRPVHGLKASDFTVSENSAPQVIRDFEEHTALTQADATKFAPMPKLPPGVFTNYTPTPVSGAVNILLLDKLNTAMLDQVFVRQQLLAYLKSTPPGTRIAIFGLTTRLILLQGFTSNPETLKMAMEEGRSKASPVLDDQVGGGGVQESMTDKVEDMSEEDSNSGISAAMVADMRQFDAQITTEQTMLRAKTTLDAMNQIASYVSNIPGRKNLVWFSGSFPIDILPDDSGAQTDPFAAMASSEEEYRETVDLLSRSQVAVYPIDARGLINSPVFDASTNRNYTGGAGTARMSRDELKFTTDIGADQSTMLDMADATGGHAFVNTNDLTKATAMAIDDGSNFYTLSYMPANYKPDGKLHKIKVEVAHRGVNLSYRRGYYADDPSKPNSGGIKDGAVVSTDGQNSADTLRLAMMRGTPPPSDILMTAGVVPINPANQPEDAPAPGDQLAAKTHGPYRRYSVNYAINPHDILFYRGDDGKIHSDFQLIIYVLTPDGELVNLHSSTVRVAATLEQLGKDFANGIFRHEEVSAPIKGEYFLRIAVHDLHRDRYGAVEVATSQVNRLVLAPPVSSPQAAPGPATLLPKPASTPASAPAPASK